MAIASNGHRAALVFQNIEIARMDGVRDRFGIDSLSPGINLVHGPNGIGKSRTAIALQALIWPDVSSSRAEIIGNLRVSDSEWRVDLNAGRVQYQRDGVPGHTPEFASLADSHRDRYLLTLQDLLRVDNRDFAREIQREAAGGYDLARVSDALRTRSGRPTKALGDLEAAESQVAKLRRDEQSLRQEELSLADARRELDRAIAASERVRMLEAARDHADARERLRDARIAREAFADPIGRMSGDEHEQVQELAREIRELELRRSDLVRDIRQHTQNLEATGFADQPPSPTLVQTLRERLDQLRQCEVELEQARRDVTSAKTTADLHRSRLGTSISDEQLAALDGDGLRQLSRLTRAYWEADSVHQAQKALEAWLGSHDTSGNADQLRRGADLLTRFLQVAQTGQHALSPLVRWALLGAALLISLEAMVLAVEVSPGFLLLALVAVPVAWVAFRNAAPDVTQDDHIREEYSRLDLPTPEDWSRDQVLSALEDVQREIAKTTLEHQKQLRWGELADKRAQAKESRDALDWQRRQLLNAFGVIPDDQDPESLRHIAHALESWRNATDALTGAESRATAIEQRRQHLLATINQDLTRWGLAGARDGSEASASLDVLAGRVTQADRSRTAMRRDTASLEQDIEPRIEGIERRLAELYTSLALTDGDENRLRDLCDGVEACREAQRALEQAEAVVETSLARLEDAPDYAALSREEVERRFLEAESEASRRDEIQARISTIDASLRQARRQTTLEVAIAAESEAVEALEDSRQQAYEAAAASRVLAFIQDRNDERNRPAVFGVADEYFRLFTTGMYRLGITDGSTPEFLAIDTATGRSLELVELSSGTRVQLLLAVRLAFIESSEHGPQLPLILDETLGNTDDLRATAVIDAAIEVARRGRQIIYFTAQRDEIAKWHSRLDDQDNGPTWEVFDLALIRGDARAETTPALDWNREVFDVADIPDDADYHQLHALLGVPPVDMWAERADGVDLWYLIPDIEPLMTLRNRGVGTWGQYLALHKSQHLDGIEAEHLHARATARAQVIETVCREWRRGRPKPLSKPFLHTSEFISDTFRERVEKCAERHGWSGDALIQALRNGEVSRFWQSNVDGLEGWFREHGHITDTEPVPHDMIRARALSIAARSIEQDVIDAHEVDRLLMSMAGEFALVSKR